MKNTISYMICALLCVCFFSCRNVRKDLDQHQNRCDSIMVTTVNGDTVIIYSHGSGHVIIIPKDYTYEK